MSGFTSTVEIHHAVKLLLDFEGPVSVLQAIAQGEKLSDQAVASHWCTVRKIYSKDNISSQDRIVEAVNSNRPHPTKNWANWFRELVAQRNLDSPEVSGLGAVLDRAMVHFDQFAKQLPAPVRQKLNCDPSAPPWFFRTRVRDCGSLDRFTLVDQKWIVNSGGPKKFVRTEMRWSNVRPLLDDDKWCVEWPNPNPLISLLQKVLAEFEKDGRTEFSPTLEEVKATILQVVKAEHEKYLWLPVGTQEIELNNQAKLIVGALTPPSRLTPSGLKHEVQFENRPLPVPDHLYQEALGQLMDEGVLFERQIESTNGGTSERMQTTFICWSGGQSVAPTLSIMKEPYLFRRNGDYWLVRFQGFPEDAPLRIRHKKGMTYIHHLLEKQGIAISAFDLVHGGIGLFVDPKLQAGVGPAEEPMDDEACAKMYEALTEAKIDKELAIKNNDVPEVERQQSLIDSYMARLANIKVIKGKVQKKPAKVLKNASNAVYKAIRSIKSQLETDFPELENHLMLYIKTGSKPKYTPPNPIPWQL